MPKQIIAPQTQTGFLGSTRHHDLLDLGVLLFQP